MSHGSCRRRTQSQYGARGNPGAPLLPRDRHPFRPRPTPRPSARRGIGHPLHLQPRRNLCRRSARPPAYTRRTARLPAELSWIGPESGPGVVRLARAPKPRTPVPSGVGTRFHDAGRNGNPRTTQACLRACLAPSPYRTALEQGLPAGLQCGQTNPDRDQHPARQHLRRIGRRRSGREDFQFAGRTRRPGHRGRRYQRQDRARPSLPRRFRGDRHQPFVRPRRRPRRGTRRQGHSVRRLGRRIRTNRHRRQQHLCPPLHPRSPAPRTPDAPAPTTPAAPDRHRRPPRYRSGCESDGQRLSLQHRRLTDDH